MRWITKQMQKKQDKDASKGTPPELRTAKLEAPTEHQHAPAPTDVREVEGVSREGDGVDPREEAKRAQRASRRRRQGESQRTHRHERYLAQVHQEIDFALQLATSPVLNALMVREVVDEGGSLLVVLGPQDPTAVLDLSEAKLELQHASSMLSREVAREITRKQAPKLSYVVLPAGAKKADD
jgi:hypothetical protein